MSQGFSILILNFSAIYSLSAQVFQFFIYDRLSITWALKGERNRSSYREVELCQCTTLKNFSYWNLFTGKFWSHIAFLNKKYPNYPFKFQNLFLWNKSEIKACFSVQSSHLSMLQLVSFKPVQGCWQTGPRLWCSHFCSDRFRVPSNIFKWPIVSKRNYYVIISCTKIFETNSSLNAK